MPSLQEVMIHVFIPPRQEPAEGEKPPLLLLLHEGGSMEYEPCLFADELDPRFIGLSLRAPHVSGPDRYEWYPQIYAPDGSLVVDETRAAESREKLSRFIDEAVTTHGADPARVYLLGLGDGAAMCLYLALTEPQKIAGTVLIRGARPPEGIQEMAATDALQGKRFFVAYGEADSDFIKAERRQVRDLLQSLPVSLTYREYSMGYMITRKNLADMIADLKNWLKL